MEWNNNELAAIGYLWAIIIKNNIRQSATVKI